MPKVVVHVTEDFLLDVAALYKETGDAAEDVRDSILNAFRLLKTGEWDDGLISPCGLLGTNFSYKFCRDYTFTFRIETYRDDWKRPIEQHYFVKNLLRKK